MAQIDFEALAKYPSVLLAALISTLLITPWVRKLALRLGLVDHPGERRIHKGVIPRIGGLAIFAGFHLASALIFLAPWKPFSGEVDLLLWKKLVLCSSILLLVGLWDDWKDVRPVWKLGGQFAVAVLTVALGIRMGNLIGGEMPIWLDWIVSIAWILLLVNAFNLIDGMDGLAAGLALVSAIGLAISLVVRRSPGDVLLFLALAGACLGFLRYNFHPASIFLGDSGSMFLGYMLAALSLSTQTKGPVLAVVGVPLFAMGVPLLDTLLAIWRRSIRINDTTGKRTGFFAALASADQDHLHHRLIRNGMNQRNAALILYGGGLILGLLGILLVAARSASQGVLMVAFVGIFYVIFRHVAVSELRQSGLAMLQGMERPTTKNSSALIYAISDSLILLGSLLVAALVVSYYGVTSLPLKTLLLKLVAGFCGIPMVTLVLARSYTRVWSLARVSEFLMVGLALATGILLGIGQIGITHPSLARTAVLAGLIYAGLAVPMVVGSRAMVRLLQDVIALTHRHGFGSTRPGLRLLLAGPSSHATNVLRMLSVTPPPGYQGCSVEGIVDDDLVLQGRTVHGVKIMGTVDELSSILDGHPVDEILVVGPGDAFLAEKVRHAARHHSARIRRLSFMVLDVPRIAERPDAVDEAVDTPIPAPREDEAIANPHPPTR